MATTRKIRFGVSAHGAPESPQDLIALARKAEDLGFSTLLVADHMSRSLSPLIASAVVLNATTTLKMSTQVLANPFRNPVVLAKEIATVDFLSGGRFEPGIGAGWPNTSRTGQVDSAQTGIDMGTAGQRVDRLADTIRIIKGFCEHDEPFDFDGVEHHLRGIVPFPQAVTRPHPPIMLAGAGPRMLRLGAAEADIINIAPRPPIVGPTERGSMGFGMTTADVVELLKEAAGDRYKDIELCAFANNPPQKNPSVTDDPDPWIEKLAEELHTTVEATRAMPHTLIGPAPALIEQIQRDREVYDVTYRTIPAYAMDEFAPIVAELAGT